MSEVEQEQKLTAFADKNKIQKSYKIVDDKGKGVEIIINLDDSGRCADSLIEFRKVDCDVTGNLLFINMKQMRQLQEVMEDLTEY